MMNRIVVNPNIHFGKPCIAGTRITVQNVLELLNDGLTFREIVQDYYPELQMSDIRACLQYAIDEIKKAFIVVEPYGHRFRKLRD